MAYEVKIAFVITKDGQPFHSTELRYDNLDYDDIVNLEKLATSSVSSLNSLGEAKAKDKKARGVK